MLKTNRRELWKPETFIKGFIEALNFRLSRLHRTYMPHSITYEHLFPVAIGLLFQYLAQPLHKVQNPHVILIVTSLSSYICQTH